MLLRALATTHGAVSRSELELHFSIEMGGTDEPGGVQVRQETKFNFWGEGVVFEGVVWEGGGRGVSWFSPRSSWPSP